jgi:hypothetical protein
MTKLFHIKIQVKKTKIDAMFDFGSQNNLIVVDVVRNIGLEGLVWVNKDAKIKVTKQCKVTFVVSVDFIDEVELDVVALGV